MCFLIEDYYLELNERVISFQFLTAKERYSQFLKSKSNLVLRITDNHIASYLGISPEKFPPYQKVMTVQKMRLTSICWHTYSRQALRKLAQVFFYQNALRVNPPISRDSKYQIKLEMRRLLIYTNSFFQTYWKESYRHP